MIKKIFSNMGIVRRNIYIPHIYVYYHTQDINIYIYIAKKKKVVEEKYFAYEEG